LERTYCYDKRLKDRETALKVIATFNGKMADGAVLPLQVRFADSVEQKRLKRQIARSRTSSDWETEVNWLVFFPRTYNSNLNLDFAVHAPFPILLLWKLDARRILQPFCI
jgi:hypothetical protein